MNVSLRQPDRDGSDRSSAGFVSGSLYRASTKFLARTSGGCLAYVSHTSRGRRGSLFFVLCTIAPLVPEGVGIADPLCGGSEPGCASARPIGWNAVTHRHPPSPVPSLDVAPAFARAARTLACTAPALLRSPGAGEDLRTHLCINMRVFRHLRPI